MECLLPPCRVILNRKGTTCAVVVIVMIGASCAVKDESNRDFDSNKKNTRSWRTGKSPVHPIKSCSQMLLVSRTGWGRELNSESRPFADRTERICSKAGATYQFYPDYKPTRPYPPPQPAACPTPASRSHAVRCSFISLSQCHTSRDVEVSVVK